MRIGRDIYLLILKPGSLLINKWAEHPFNKFMKVKEIALEHDYRCVNLHTTATGEPRLFVGLRRSFMSVDIDGGSSIDLPLDDSVTSATGAPVATVNLDRGNVMLCFEEFGYPIKPNGDPLGKPIKWRTKITGACTDFLSFFFPLVNRTNLFFPFSEPWGGLDGDHLPRQLC